MSHRPEYSYKRDMSFHVARRKWGANIPSTDIDFLEFDQLEPVLLWEAKSIRSKWKSGIRTAGMKTQWKLAQMAGIPYRVVEHNDDWSQVTVYEIKEWEWIDRSLTPIIGNETKMTLREFADFLYSIRNRDIRRELKNTLLKKTWEDFIPKGLQQIIFEYSEDGKR